uniref:TF-B3 domain-containing protein n=1 Tax=Gossypium raimondii TaxID=29730 RepID=A0A0D2PYM0_GOSRA|nr:hypothetical protein B456_005G238700 [Gossypium raimondii]
MMMNTNMKIKIEEEEEELFDDEGNDRLPISQLFQLLQQRQSISMENIRDCRQKASRKRPRDKNYNDHVVKGTKRVSEQDFAKSPVIERAEQVQANLSAEFPSFFKIMIPSVVCRGFWMSLPKEFCQLNLPNHDATVILVGETGKEYRINFLVQRKALSGGWKKFSKEHGLLVGDALVFHLIRPSKFKVYIVRMNGLDEIDAALGLLRLQSSANQTGICLFLGPKKTSQRMALWMLAPVKWKALGLLRLLALQMPLELPRFPPCDLVSCRGTTL